MSMGCVPQNTAIGTRLCDVQFVDDDPTNIDFEYIVDPSVSFVSSYCNNIYLVVILFTSKMATSDNDSVKER